MDARIKQWRYRVFAATWLSYAGFYFCRKPFFIVKSDLREAMGFDLEAIGQIGFWYLLAYTVGQFVSGALGQRWGARVLLLAGMAVSIGCNIAFGFGDSWGTFAAFMVLNGFAQATGWSGNVASMATWFHRRERGSVMGLWATNYQVGGVVANLLAAWTLKAFGFQWAFFAGSAVLSLVWLFFLFNQRNKPEDVGLKPIVDPLEAEGDQDLANKAMTWTSAVVVNVLLIGFFYFFVKFIRYALWSWTPLLLKESYGLDSGDAGYLSTVFDMAGIAGVIAAGWMSDRFFQGRRAKISFYFLVAMAASCVVLYLLGPTSLVLFAVSLGLVGFSLYGPDALMTGAGAIDVGSMRGAALAAGIINGLGSVGSVAQEIVMPKLLESGGIGAAFGALLASSIMAVLFICVLLLRNRSGQADM